jgi:hypothetical protein
MNSSGDQVRRAISIGCLQCEHYLPGSLERKVLVGDGGAGNVAAQVLRPRRAQQSYPWPRVSGFLR